MGLVSCPLPVVARPHSRIDARKRLERHAVAAARTKLEALIANDPEHPAIRDFIVCLEVILAVEGHEKTNIEAIRHLLEKLENKLTAG